MAYDREVADRLREVLGDRSDLTEKAMFGGLAFLIAGNMAIAAGSGGGLMVRVDPADSESLLRQGAERMVMNGREMAGWLLVPNAGVLDGGALQRWADVGVSYARTLPAK